MSLEDRRRGNRHQSASITRREALQLHAMLMKLEKIANKPNLFVGYSRLASEAYLTIYKLLEDSDRL